MLNTLLNIIKMLALAVAGVYLLLYLGAAGVVESKSVESKSEEHQLPDAEKKVKNP